MKKLLICTLALFAFVGLTGCGSEKQLTAEEAKTELNEISKNTALAVNDATQASIKLAVKANGNVKNLKGYKEGTTEALVTVNEAKAEAALNFTASTATDFDNKLIKLSAKADAFVKASADVAGMEKMSINYKADGKADAYLKGGEGKANAYVDYSANIPEELAEKAKIDAKLAGKYNIKLEGMDISMPTDEQITENFSIDFDEFINDWSIFKKKGNKIIADCSNLEAFKIGDEVIAVQKKLAEYGLKFGVNKFEVGFDSQKRITSFDFNLGFKGTADFAKMNLSKADIEDMAETLEGVLGSAAALIGQLDSITGTLTLDLSVSLTSTIKYSAAKITIPEELTKIEEKTIDEIMGKPTTAPLTD